MSFLMESLRASTPPLEVSSSFAWLQESGRSVLIDVCCEHIVSQLSAISLVWAYHVGCESMCVCVRERESVCEITI